MPDKVGRFQLYSDTSKYATGGGIVSNTEWKAKIDSVLK